MTAVRGARLVLVALSACAAEPDEPDRPLRCNGHAALCDRPYDALVVPMAHNAMSSAEEGWLAPNQTFAVPTQLRDGIRGFMLDTHWDEATGEPALCHADCALGSTPLVDGLRIFTDFLDANPGEVLTFMVQNGIDAETTEAAFAEADLLRYAHAHDPGTPWPTLRELVQADTRLVVFHEGGGTFHGWYMDGYADFVWDTAYGQDRPEDMDCAPLRGDPDHDLFLMNHFLTAPIALPSLAEQVNHNPFLIDRARRCGEEAGQPVNWIAVDFYDIGDVIETAEILNGVGG